MSEIQSPLEELGWDVTSDHIDPPDNLGPNKEMLITAESEQIIIREQDNHSACLKTVDPVLIKE